jgi:alkylhydroperoxidase/carboxymuconolactone decarboxylase family protein YurZ
MTGASSKETGHRVQAATKLGGGWRTPRHRIKLDEKTYFLVRLAALVAMDAAPVSYVINLGLAGEAGVTLEDVQNLLIAIAPVVGSARVAAAAGSVLQGAFDMTAAEQAQRSRPEGRS